MKFPSYVSWYMKEKERKRNADKYAKSTINVNRHFDQFMKDFVACTEQIYTKDMLLSDPPLADAYICGSDQVWGGDWAYYLDFAPDDKPLIAYAPSLGGITSFSSDYERKCVNC